MTAVLCICICNRGVYIYICVCRSKQISVFCCCFCLQHLAQLCTVVTDCVSAFCIDFWLQTNLFQSGVLWHLLPNLFQYDFTLDEGGVERSHETNQQVCSVLLLSQCQAFILFISHLYPSPRLFLTSSHVSVQLHLLSLSYKNV